MPRDPNRINPTCNGLAIAWRRRSDMRFGQLLYNAVSMEASKRLQAAGKKGTETEMKEQVDAILFNIEDIELLKLLNNYLS